MIVYFAYTGLFRENNIRAIEGLADCVGILSGTFAHTAEGACDARRMRSHPTRHVLNLNAQAMRLERAP